LALILDKQPFGENGSLVYLFTKELGFVEARAMGTRRIVSKLSAHLEPNCLSEVRLIEKNGFLLVDALRKEKKNFSWEILNILKKVSAVGEKDLKLWEKINPSGIKDSSTGQAQNDLSARFLLDHMGFNPKYVKCSVCGEKEGQKVFYLNNQEFICGNCLMALKVSRDEVVYI